MTDTASPENPQAFPNKIGFGTDAAGMTLRDWFAGQVMAQCFAEHHGNDWGRGGCKHAPLSAAQAYKFADAMLRERQP